MLNQSIKTKGIMAVLYLSVITSPLTFGEGPSKKGEKEGGGSLHSWPKSRLF